MTTRNQARHFFAVINSNVHIQRMGAKLRAPRFIDIDEIDILHSVGRTND